jgi:hypothetical protein
MRDVEGVMAVVMVLGIALFGVLAGMLIGGIFG